MAIFHYNIRGDSVAERAFKLRHGCWTMRQFPLEEMHVMLVVDTLGPLAQIEAVAGDAVFVSLLDSLPPRGSGHRRRRASHLVAA